MARMLEMIRQSAVPANLMRSASRGALALPASEMLEILVYLTTHPMFGEQARMTLAGWDEQSAIEIASDPSTAPEILDYLVRPNNLRPNLLPALLENGSLPEQRLQELAQSVSPQLVALMLVNERVRKSANVLHALETNDNLEPAQLESIRELLAQISDGQKDGSDEQVLDTPELNDFLDKHAVEIEAEQNKEFQLFRNEDDAADELDELVASMDEDKKKAETVLEQKHARKEEKEKVSTLQKIARLTVGERVQLAMKGTKDERFILIRDGSKVVSLAVLESPKLTDTEAETFATMKNVQEAVLRGIAGKRKFMKNYAVIRALVNNPRLPLDVALPLLPHLLALDLRHLSMNKNVGETLRKLAMKLFKEKTQSRKRE